MSYIDGFSDRNADTIRVVERKDGKRVFKEFLLDIHFSMKIPKGKYKSTQESPHRIVCKIQKTSQRTSNKQE